MNTPIARSLQLPQRKPRRSQQPISGTKNYHILWEFCLTAAGRSSKMINDPVAACRKPECPSLTGEAVASLRPGMSSLGQCVVVSPQGGRCRVGHIGRSVRARSRGLGLIRAPPSDSVRATSPRLSPEVAMRSNDTSVRRIAMWR